CERAVRPMKTVFAYIWAALHFVLLVLGMATLVSLGWFYGVIWWEGQPSPIMTPPPIRVSPVAQRAAALISPGIQSIARDSEDAIVASAGGVVAQWAARKVYPFAVSKVPVVAEVGCDHLLSRFGEMPVGEVAAWLVEHAASKGQVPHWTIR